MKRLSFSSRRCGNIKISSVEQHQEQNAGHHKASKNKTKTKTKTKTYAQYVKKSTAALNKIY